MSKLVFNNQDCNGTKLYSLEAHFEKICSTHPHLKLLESQWRFDQELISKALQNVNMIFPHYSRHDASHSKQIIVNIERMLGDKIQYLSATDTWLILEAAYNHDIGMVITHKQIQDMESPEFESFVRTLARNSEDNLNKFAKKWLKDKAKLPQGKAAHDFFNKYIQLLAEWYRAKHPVNSAKIVREPFNEINLNSPRNELLPKRLFKVLADICQAHGENFEYVKDLPKAEAGMATEDCHPRYIACLLRMGDLLDVDDNRFCPVMMSMCGHHLPKTSNAHLDKHHSIKHFRLDAERIEIISECPTPESYEVAYEWFKWLEQEYHKQTQHWDQIIPYKELGTLPTLTTPVVKIQEPFLILEQGKKPNFKINQSAILELVRGTGLYSSKFDSIREILQNAVDATLIAAWQEHSKEIENLNPSKLELFEIMSKYAITVSFEPEPENNNIWDLKIQDKGTGISLDTLHYMLEVGASSKNKIKIECIEQMPMWYRPSGNFGLGLQSAYLLSDKFTITTKSRATHEALKIKFFNKLNKPVVIKKIPSKELEYGTTFEIKIRFDDEISSDSNPSYNNNSDIFWFENLGNYDFIKNDFNFNNYFASYIFDSILKFSKHSPIPITSGDRTTQPKNNVFFDIKENVILSNIKFQDNRSARIFLYFRGQALDNMHQIRESYPGIGLDIDYYHDTAKNFLTYNRERVLSEVYEKAETILENSLNNYIILNFNNIPVEQQPIAAIHYFVLNYNNVPDFILESAKKLIVNVSTNANTMLLHELIEKVVNGSISKILVVNAMLSDYIDTFDNKENNLTNNESAINISNHTAPIFIEIVKFFALKAGYYIQSNANDYSLENMLIGDEYIFSKEDIQPISDDLIKQILLQNIIDHRVGFRRVFPCWGKYRKLAISTTRTNISLPRVIIHAEYHSDIMVLPCIFTKISRQCVAFDDSIELVNWVYENRKNIETTFDDIQNTYKDLINYLKVLIA